jgi:hypothetical protein
MTSMRERIARAISDNIRLRDIVEDGEEVGFEVDPDSEARAADAVLAALRQATPEMHRAGEISIENGSGANHVWRAMIDAASCDSGGLPKGEDPSGAECGASQSGGSEASASPITSSDNPYKGRARG